MVARACFITLASFNSAAVWLYMPRCMEHAVISGCWDELRQVLLKCIVLFQCVGRLCMVYSQVLKPHSFGACSATQDQRSEKNLLKSMKITSDIFHPHAEAGSGLHSAELLHIFNFPDYWTVFSDLAHYVYIHYIYPVCGACIQVPNTNNSAVSQ